MSKLVRTSSSGAHKRQLLVAARTVVPAKTAYLAGPELRSLTLLATYFGYKIVPEELCKSAVLTLIEKTSQEKKKQYVQV